MFYQAKYLFGKPKMCSRATLWCLVGRTLPNPDLREYDNDPLLIVPYSSLQSSLIAFVFQKALTFPHNSTLIDTNGRIKYPPCLQETTST